MDELDDRLRSASRELRSYASAEAVSSRPTGARDASRLAISLLAVLLVAGIVVGSMLLIIRPTGSDERVAGRLPPPPTDAASTDHAATTTGASERPTTTTASAPAGPMHAGLEPVSRPILDSSVCQATRATETIVENAKLFTRPSSATLPIQVVGLPTASPADAFVVVQRFFADQRTLGPGTRAQISDSEGRVRVDAAGAGEAVWNLADGSQGYARSRGMTEAELLSLVRNLQPRDPTSAVPGFETALPFVVIAEGIDGVSGTVAASYCTPPGLGEINVAAYIGDALFRFAATLDRGQPIQVIDDSRGTLVIGGGVDVPSSAIRNATTDEWQQLLDA